MELLAGDVTHFSIQTLTLNNGAEDFASGPPRTCDHVTYICAALTLLTLEIRRTKDQGLDKNDAGPIKAPVKLTC